ncbi:hypothetical protein D3C86_1765820 [compost metagenome]
MYLDFDDRLGNDRLISGFLYEHFKGFKGENLFKSFECFAKQKLKRCISTFELIALMFHFLDFLDDFFSLLVLFVKVQVKLLRFDEDVTLTS